MYIIYPNLFLKLFLLSSAHLSKSFLRVGSIKIINYILTSAQSNLVLAYL